MFLKKLFRYNKVLFILVTAFIVAYFYLNYKWGITATPINQYGMYSGEYFFRDSILIYSVKANDTIINLAELSVIDRDLLQSYPEYYEMEGKNNEVIFNTVSKYFNYLGISAYKHKNKFTNSCSDSLFSSWYKAKVERIINRPITSLEVFKQNYLWKDKKLQPIDTPVKLTFIAAN